MLLFNQSEIPVEELSKCVFQNTRLMIFQNTARITYSTSLYSPLLEKVIEKNVSLFKEYSLTLTSSSLHSSNPAEIPPSLTTRVISLSTPQTHLREELITELVDEWNKRMEKVDQGRENSESVSEQGGVDEDEKNEKTREPLSEKDLMQGFFTILRQVDQLEAPEKSSCVLPPLEYDIYE